MAGTEDIVMKPKFVQAFMRSAEVFAELSSAQRLKVGCVIVKDNRIISIGYNGMPSGWDNVCEHQMPEEVDADSRTITPAHTVTKPEVLHAETNAIAKVAQSSESSVGATLFCTHAPCLDCAKLIHQSGITTVYYGDKYKSDAGLNFLEKCSITVEQLVKDTL